MPWVNLIDNSATYPHTFELPSGVLISGNTIVATDAEDAWFMDVLTAWPVNIPIRVNVLSFSGTAIIPAGGSTQNTRFEVGFQADLPDVARHPNMDWPSNGFKPEGTIQVNTWSPATVQGPIPFGSLGNYVAFDTATYDMTFSTYSGSFTIEIFLDDPTPPSVNREYAVASTATLVNEFEKGWSFDGQFIPHYVEMNWWFGESPVTYNSLQKLRIHGLSKGWTKLTLAVNSMETDMLDYKPFFTEPQWIDLPRNIDWVTGDYMPVTNYTDTASRGISTQMKFEGRNTDPALPEPSHVIQVLVLQSSPGDTGATSH